MSDPALPTFGPEQNNFASALVLIVWELMNEESELSGMAAWEHLAHSIVRQGRIPLEEVKSLERTVEDVARRWSAEERWAIWLDTPRGSRFGIEAGEAAEKPWPFLLEYELKAELVDWIVKSAWDKAEEVMGEGPPAYPS